MIPEMLESAKEKLLVKKEDLEERILKLKMNKTRANGPLEADSKEQAIELQSKEVVDALDDLEYDELEKINLALKSIENGSYGVCISCGSSIPEARLKAIPYTRHCVDCVS